MLARSSQPGAEFRRRHRPGDVIRGAVVRHLGGGLTLLSVGGQELTAHMGPDARPGSQHLFRVEALTPHILLKHLPGQPAGDGLTPAEHLPGVRAARDRLEALLREGGSGGLPQSVAHARQGFFGLLARKSQARLAFAETLSLLFQANHSSRLHHAPKPPPVRLGYRPWLLPRAWGTELAVTPAGTPGAAHWLFTFQDPHIGPAEFRLRVAEGWANCQLATAHADAAQELLPWLDQVALTLAPRARHAQIKLVPLKQVPAGAFALLAGAVVRRPRLSVRA